jgi:hypothetical protein
MTLHDVEHRSGQVVEDGDLYWTEVVIDSTRNALKHNQSSVTIVQPTFGIECYGFGIGKHSI